MSKDNLIKMNSNLPKYDHIHGAIFKGTKQLMILVNVEVSPKLRDKMADLIVDHLNKKKK